MNRDEPRPGAVRVAEPNWNRPVPAERASGGVGGSFWQAVWCEAVRRFRAEGVSGLFQVGVAAAVAQSCRADLESMLSAEVFVRHLASDPQADLLFPVSHRHFLCKGLPFDRRIKCAETHFTYEGQHYDKSYQAAVYGGPGLELWRCSIDGVCFTIVLRSPPELRHEGLVSVLLMADGLPLHQASFAWTDARLLDSSGDAGPVIFITRNQSVRFHSPALAAFRNSFPQNSPSYFCLAAIHGVAAVNRQTRIAGIRHDCQIAYDAEHAESFRRSYCDFWRPFGATESGSLAYLMPVPAQVTPLSAVKSNHRARARSRRKQWDQITRSAAEALDSHWRFFRAPRTRTPPEKPHFAFATMLTRSLLPMLLTLTPVLSGIGATASVAQDQARRVSGATVRDAPIARSPTHRAEIMAAI
jgi:uncharacterized protein VirK/YbjX